MNISEAEKILNENNYIIIDENMPISEKFDIDKLKIKDADSFKHSACAIYKKEQPNGENKYRHFYYLARNDDEVKEIAHDYKEDDEKIVQLYVKPTTPEQINNIKHDLSPKTKFFNYYRENMFSGEDIKHALHYSNTATDLYKEVIKFNNIIQDIINYYKKINHK